MRENIRLTTKDFLSLLCMFAQRIIFAKILPCCHKRMCNIRSINQGNLYLLLPLYALLFIENPFIIWDLRGNKEKNWEKIMPNQCKYFHCLLFLVMLKVSAQLLRQSKPSLELSEVSVGQTVSDKQKKC